jgi:2-polyprenyl-3-methyl-5-hydroxy-6-metoxy-1,4-benzoquinol methylase
VGLTEPPSDALQALYEKRAEAQYAAPAPPPDPRRDRKFERLAALLEAELPCERLLDAGCGDGRYFGVLSRATERPGAVVASDISERILDTARATAQRDGLAVELVRANMEALPFEDGSFDVVFSSQVIEHLLDPAAGARELARVLRPGGRLVLSTDNRRAHVSAVLNAPRQLAVRALRLQERLHPVTFPHAAFGMEELRAQLEGVGLQVTHEETFRFHLQGIRRPLFLPLVSALDRRLPAHRFGDILAVVATKTSPAPNNSVGSSDAHG